MHLLVLLGESLTLILAYVEVMFCLPLFTDQGATGIVLTEKEQRILQLLNVALRVSNKLT